MERIQWTKTGTTYIGQVELHDVVFVLTVASHETPISVRRYQTAVVIDGRSYPLGITGINAAKHECATWYDQYRAKAARNLQVR